ncbi:uncharacterized protein LOC133295831 [Gastrolobium bilobum]|uniref:uncharacterized protein LOC133295831 n=1 Tax=Gastrolobium bilobum TaxID=150636 RepID=UPI002AB1EA8A|nr:uncharacterized protein LOC133295831 [Gastrolobium bilobum]
MTSTPLKITYPKSPFFLHASDHPGVILTTVLLRGQSNYENWSKLMSNALKAKNKLGFVNDNIKQPTDKDSDEAHAWSLCNSMINNWIHNTLDPQMQPFIKCFETAKGLWDDLKERFAVANVPRIFQLKSSLATMKQHGTSITDYYTKLCSIWDELESSRTFNSCASGDTCAYTRSVNAEIEKDIVYQFLIGLDHHVYGTLITQILNTNPLPTINRVFAMVIQEESHKAMVCVADTPADALGYAFTNSASDSTKPHITCTHCGRSGHDVSRCYKLHGYPDRAANGHGYSDRAATGRGRGRPVHASANATHTDVSSNSGGSSKPLSVDDLTP